MESMSNLIFVINIGCHLVGSVGHKYSGVELFQLSVEAPQARSTGNGVWPIQNV